MKSRRLAPWPLGRLRDVRCGLLRCWTKIFTVAFAGLFVSHAGLAAKLSTTGTVDVPGDGELSYTVSVQKVPLTNKISFWLDLENHESFPITVIACAMIRLDKPEIQMPQFTVEKTAGKWVCAADGMISRPPGFHFGCKKVTVPRKVGTDPGVTQAFDVTRDLGRPFQQKDIAAVYWDVLEGQNCQLDSSCDIFDRPDVNLTPATLDVITNSANIWGGNWFSPECLDDDPDHSATTAFWDVGNWITMGFPDIYPARVSGQITDVPSGTALTLTLPGISPLKVNAPASGVIAIDEVFDIPADPHAIATLTIDDNVAIDSEVHFDASVLAEPGNPVYEPGDFMYGLAIDFFHDCSPPSIDSVEVSFLGDLAIFDVQSSDVDTMPGAASVSISGASPQVIALDFGDPAVDDQGNVNFTGTLILVGGEFFDYEVIVADTAGNLASFLGTVDPPPFCGDEVVDPGEECGEPGLFCSGDTICLDCQCVLAVTLSGFAAQVTDHQIVLTWSTNAELHNQGFNVLRGEDPEQPGRAINKSFISAIGGPAFGGQYKLTDDTLARNITYYYMLEHIDTSGVRTLHGAGGCRMDVDSMCKPIEITIAHR